jgi:hypothetical protein
MIFTNHHLLQNVFWLMERKEAQVCLSELAFNIGASRYIELHCVSVFRLPNGNYFP